MNRVIRQHSRGEYRKVVWNPNSTISLIEEIRQVKKWSKFKYDRGHGSGEFTKEMDSRPLATIITLVSDERRSLMNAFGIF